MNIAVNTRLLLKGRLDGTGWFTFETLKRIAMAHPRHRFMFFFDRPYSRDFIFSGNVEPFILPPQSRHPVLWYLWFEHSLPKILKSTGADIFVSPDGYLSLSSDIPSLAILHDINFMHRPDFHPFFTRIYYRHFFPKFASKASRIATVSEYSRNDISNTFGIPSEEIDVVYNGASELYTPLSGEEKVEAKKQYAGGKDYFIFAGSFHKRKNVAGLLDAYECFKRETGKDIKLVLVGEKMHGYPLMEKTLERLTFRKDIIFTGRMEPVDLRKVYGAAIALVYIPFFEGFGIPVLESMCCDTPVIASNRTSLPEVAGDAALLVDPGNIRSVVEGMIRVSSDESLRRSLVEKGRVRRKLFSWDITAALLWKSIEKTLDPEK